VNPESRSRIALAWVWLISAWVLTGATFKLFWGTPALLPQVLRDLPLEIGVTYNLAIGIELAISWVALTKPRWGWWMQVALLLVFDAVLTQQIAAGAKSCGCFGTKLEIDPRIMMGADTLLLAGLVSLRPWSCLGIGLPAGVPVVLAAIGLALPWFLERELETGDLVANGKQIEGLPWSELAVERWVGLDISETPLGKPPLNQFIDVNQLALDGLWVFWRATCDHCAKHLAHLADTEDGTRFVTLIQLEEAHDTVGNRVVNKMPSGNFVKEAKLPPSIAYLISTPAELVLEAGKVVKAKEGVTPEDGL